MVFRRYLALPISLFSAIMFLIGTSATAQNSVKKLYNLHDTEDTKTLSVKNTYRNNLIAGNCYNGVFTVAEDYSLKNHIFDKDGNLLGTVSDVRALNFYDGRIALGWTPRSYILSLVKTDGSVIKQLDCGGTPYGPIDGVASTAIDWGRFKYTVQYINEKGEFIYKHISGSVNELVRVFPLIENRRRYYFNNSFGYIDSSGKIAIPAKYSSALDFSEGLAAVAIREGDTDIWGYIDVNGKFIIAPKYHQNPSSFSDGLAVAKKQNDLCVYIDKTGNAISPEYKQALPFYKGVAWVITTDNKTVIVDKSFNVIKEIPLVDELLQPCILGRGVYLSHKTGLITFNRYYGNRSAVYALDTGECLLSEYDMCFGEPTDDVFYFIYKDNVGGYVNRKGEVVLRIVESDF